MLLKSSHPSETPRRSHIMMNLTDLLKSGCLLPDTCGRVYLIESRVVHDSTQLTNQHANPHGSSYDISIRLDQHVSFKSEVRGDMI